MLLQVVWLSWSCWCPLGWVWLWMEFVVVGATYYSLLNRCLWQREWCFFPTHLLHTALISGIDGIIDNGGSI